MTREPGDRRRTLRAELDQPLDAEHAEREAMRLVGELHERVARERETVRVLKDHLEQ